MSGVADAFGQGGKTSSSTSNTQSPFAPYLAKMGQKMFQEGNNFLQPFLAQSLEALQTGGVNAQIPSTNAALASARMAASSNMKAIQNHLSQAGLASTSFGQQILAQVGAGQNQDIASIPTAMAQNFIKGGVGAASSAVGAGIGAMGTAGGLDTMSSGTQTQSEWSALLQGLQEGTSIGNMGKNPPSTSGASAGFGAATSGGSSSPFSASDIAGLGSSASSLFALF